MSTAWRRRRTLSGGAVALTLLAVALGPGASAASAAVPTVDASWSSQVFATTAKLNATLNPNGLSTGYHFDYIAKAAYDANGGNFTGAARVPALSDATAGSGGASVGVLQSLSSLAPDTTYHYRLVATNASGTTYGPDRYFTTFPQPANASDPCANAAVRTQQNVKALLADCRAWEMVSPIDKNGGQVDPPGTLAGGGVLQAATGDGAVTYSSAASFAGGASGAPAASQYVGSRTPSGWSTQNITAALFSGSYDTETGGAPYRIFSGDLARGLLLSGKHCRGTAAAGCPVANPPLPGTDAPAGYQNYYLRDGGTGGFEALLGAGDVAGLSTDPADFSLSFAGASADLQHVVLSSCSALAGAADGCPGDANLYEWSGGALSPINPAPGAALAAQSGAVSDTGSRVYWTDTTGGDLFVRSGAQTKQVDADAGGGGTFETASADGSVAFFTVGGHLWRYLDSSGHASDLTPSGGVTGVLGADAKGDYVYFQDGAGLKLWHSATTTQVASGASATDSSDYHPASGTSRVSADGTKLLFVSSAPLARTDGGVYDNTDLSTKAPDSQVYLYDSSGPTLTCVSCNPTNERPLGASTIPGATHNGAGPDATVSYKPRALSADGKRVYFDSSDALVLTDTNGGVDVYQWEAQGSGGCARAAGCLSLISSGRDQEGATFADASGSGGDVYFLTDESLVESDPGSADLYDARSGGGYPVPTKPIPCTGDSCQVLPPQPVDPTLTTLLPGPGNPPLRYVNQKKAKRCKKGAVKRKGKCVRKHKRHPKQAHKRGGRR